MMASHVLTIIPRLLFENAVESFGAACLLLGILEEGNRANCYGTWIWDVA